MKQVLYDRLRQTMADETRALSGSNWLKWMRCMGNWVACDPIDTANYDLHC